MKKYIQTKTVSATPAWRVNFHVYPKDGEAPRSMNREDGYIIVSEDGGESWLPKAVFESEYREIEVETPLSFGDAIEVLKQGGTIRRKGWNGKSLMVFKQVPAHITEEIIPKMQSLPQSAKSIILNGKGFIDYTSQCLIYNEETGRADSWTPSISDVFAEDWEIVC